MNIRNIFNRIFNKRAVPKVEVYTVEGWRNMYKKQKTYTIDQAYKYIVQENDVVMTRESFINSINRRLEKNGSIALPFYK